MRNVLEKPAALPTQLRLPPAPLTTHRGVGLALAQCGGPELVLSPCFGCWQPRAPSGRKISVCTSSWRISSLLGSMAKIILNSVALCCVFISHAPGGIGTFSFGPAPLVPHSALQHPARRGEQSARSPARMCPLFHWDLGRKTWTF